MLQRWRPRLSEKMQSMQVTGLSAARATSSARPAPGAPHATSGDGEAKRFTRFLLLASGRH